MKARRRPGPFVKRAHRLPLLQAPTWLGQGYQKARAQSKSEKADLDHDLPPVRGEDEGRCVP